MLLRRLLPPLLLLILPVACSTLPEVDPGLAAQVTPAQLSAGVRIPREGRSLTWGGSVQSVTNLRDRTRIEILAFPLDRQRRPLRDRPSNGRFVLEMPGFVEPAELHTGQAVTATGRYAGTVPYRTRGMDRELPRLRGERLHVWAAEVSPALRRPDVRWGIGVGTGGSGVGVSIGL